MEEIEYLEEYEDLVLPAINSAADAAATAKSSKSVNLDNDGSSSSLDQDIFNCLFDDNSDDDNDEQQQPLKDPEIFNQKIAKRHSLDESNDSLNDLGEQVKRELSLEKRTTVIKEKNSSKAPRQKTLFSKNSGSKIELPSGISSLPSVKTKTVATVKPTLQHKTQLQKSNITKHKAPHSNASVPNASLKSTTKLNPSTSYLARHNLVENTSSFTPTVSLGTNKINTSHRPKPSFSKQRPATIVKPEKIVTKDPAEDPLNLDDLSSAESANYSVSDISGETYNSISDFDDDDYDFTSHIDALDDDDDQSSNSQVIDISNDSSESRSHFEELRGSTPSPVVSEDRDIAVTSAVIKRRSLPKFMANHEIIKSLLTKGEKPKLLQLINEHAKSDNSVNKEQDLETLELSSATVTTKNDLQIKAHVTERSVLPAYINEDNTNLKATISTELCLFSANDPKGKSKALNVAQSTEDNPILKDFKENNRKSSINVVKTSKHDSLPNQEVGAEMEIGNEELIEESLNLRVENMKDSKVLEQTKIAQTSKLEKKYQPTNVETKCLDTAEIRKKAETPISIEVSNELASVRPRKKRFRNLITPELLDRDKDKSIEIINHTKSDEPSIQSDNAGVANNEKDNNNVLKQQIVLPIDCAAKLKAEENVTTIKLMSKESFKSPTKGVDITNKNNSNRDRSCDSSTDKSRETSNKHIKDVPRGVIMNPFVQRTTKNTFSKDGRAKMPRESSRDNSRESSVESSRSCSKDRYKDNANTCKLVRSEIATIIQQESKPKDLRETIKNTDAVENPVSADTEKRETPKSNNNTDERKSENKIKINDNDIKKNKSVATKDIETDVKNTAHLADTKKEATKISSDIEGRRSDIKMTAKYTDVNKSIGHVSKATTSSTISRKGTTEKEFADKPLKANECISGPSNLNAAKPKYCKDQIKLDIVSNLPSKGDNVDTKDNKCKESSKDDNDKEERSAVEIAKMSKNIADSSRLHEKSKEQKDLKESSQSIPAGSIVSNKKSLTNKESSVDVSNEINKSTTEKTAKKSLEKSSDTIKFAVVKDFCVNKIANKPSIMPSETYLTTGTSESKVLVCEKKNLKESKTTIRNKEASKLLTKGQDKPTLHSQDHRHIKSKEKCATSFTDSTINKSKAEGKSFISKTSVNTAKITETERRLETVKSESDDKKRLYVATSIINPQKNITKPFEEKKRIKVVSTSICKKISKDLPIKSVADVSKEVDCTISGKRDVSKHVIEQVVAAKTSEAQRKSSMDKSTDDEGPKYSGNKTKSCSEQTTRSKKNEKSDSKVGKCVLIGEEESKVNIDVNESGNSFKDVKAFEGADQESISNESDDKSGAVKSKDDHSTSIINCSEINSQNLSELSSAVSKDLKETSVKDSKLSKIKDEESMSLAYQDLITSHTLTQLAIADELNDEQNNEFTGTINKGEVSESGKKDINIQQDEKDTNEFKSDRMTPETSLKLRTIEPNTKDTTNVFYKNYLKKPDIKQDVKDVSRSEKESATDKISTDDEICKDLKDKRKQIINDTSIEKEIHIDPKSTEIYVSIEENISSFPAEASTLVNTEAINEHALAKSPAVNIRKTRSSKPDEILIQEETNVLCNPLKAAEPIDVVIKNTYFETRKSKNAKSDEINLSNRAHLEISNKTQEESKEPFVKSDISCEQTEIDKSSDQPTATSLKNVMRKTRSTANTDDGAKYEPNSLDDPKLYLSNNLKTNENTIKTPQRNIRKNKNTQSKCEELEEDSKSEEHIVSKCKNVSLDELNQFHAVMNTDENDANISPQKKNRKSRYMLDPRADNTNQTRSGDYETSTKSKYIVEPSALNSNKDEPTQSKSKIVKKSDTIMLGSDSDKTTKPIVKETSKSNAACIRNETPETTDEGHKSTDSVLNLPAQIIAKTCIDEPKRIQHFDDDVNKKECKPIATLEPSSAMENISKNSEYLSRHSAFAGHPTRDLLINEVESTNVATKTHIQNPNIKNVAEPTITKNLKTTVSKIGRFPVSTTSNEPLETLTLSKCLPDTEPNFSKEAICYSAERARTLRKRGAESPFCENRDGANKTLFKTPTNVFESSKAEIPLAPEGKIRRRLRSPAAEKDQQAPLSKKCKIDIKKARNRNIDVDILGTSESLSDIVAEQLPGTSKQTRVLSPRRSLQKKSVHINELLFDSTAQASYTKSNISMPCKLEDTLRDPLCEGRLSAEKPNQLVCNFIDERTSSCINSQCTKAKSNIAVSKCLDLSDAKERKQIPGMSKTYPDNEISYPEKRPSCSILSFAEWLRGNNRNDASQMKNQSIASTTNIQTELNDTSKTIGVQGFIPKPHEENIPGQITDLHSHVSRQVSPKRSRKVKCVPNYRRADNKESVENVKNSSEITKGKNCFQLHISQGEFVANNAMENVAEQITNPITKKLSQMPENTDTSPKRSRKLKTISIVQSENNKECTSHDAETEKREPQSDIAAPQKLKYTKLKISMESKEDISSAQDTSNECLNAISQLNSSLAGESIDAENIRDIKDNVNLSLTTNSPSLKSGRRRPKIRSGRVLVSGIINKDQQKIKSMHPRQDKKPIKRTEIDILIESMPKEMRDAGIKDLLNTSSNVKRQRAVVKRVNTAESANVNPANLVINEVVTKEKIIKDTASIIDSAGNTGEGSKTSPSRRSLSKKLVITKESNKNTREPLRPMEMEKALIDEAEIRNMNTSLLEPLKYELMKQHRPSSKLALKASSSFQSSGFKTPKPLATINRIKSAEDVSQLYRGKSNTNINDSVRRISSLKCRMLKVRLNRRVVTKYLQYLGQVDTSDISLMNRTQNNPIKSPAIATSTTINVITPKEADISMQTAGSSTTKLHEVKEISEDIEAPALPTINKGPGEAYKKQQSFITPKALHTPALADERSNIQYTASYNVARGNSRSVEENLADSVMEPIAPIELKNEFLDENPNSLGDATLPDTPTLIARSQTITQAAASALSNTIMPTDIRLLTNDPMSTRAFVPSFGVTPTLVDAKGARMYTFLHPAKYSRNHGNVLLDYCCPNLDGPMPAIDPTRIHAQVQTPVIELPSCVVLTTKVVTRAELESKSSTIPAVIRKKAEKLRSNIHQNVGVPHEKGINTVTSQSPRPLHLHPPQITNSSPLQHPLALKSVMPVMEPSKLSTATNFSPAINALAKYLPSTTTITAKIRSPISQPRLTLPVPNANQHASSVVSVVTKGSPLLSETQVNLLRSYLRRVDVTFKSLVQPFEKLNFTERHRIMDNLVASGKFLPKDLERTIVLMEEYLKQINAIQRNQITDASGSNNIVNAMPTQLKNLAPIRMPSLQPAPNLSSSTFKADTDQNVEQVHNTAIRKVQSTVKQHNTTVNTTTIKQRQVPIYDTERNIIGYQLQVITPATTMPAYTKSALSTTSGGILSSSLGASSNNPRKSLKRPAQDSPRVFYTSQPMQASTPKANLNSTQYSTTPMNVNQNAQTIGNSQNGSIVATMRSAGPTSAGTETITTTTMATVKRVTRSRAAGSKIIIVSKSNSNEETILPDVNHQTEIKHEKDVEDFIG